MTFIRRHLLRGEGKLNAFQLRPTSTTTGVPGSHVDIHVKVNAQNRNVTVILQALLEGPGKLLLVGVHDFADLRPKNHQNSAPFVDLRA